MSVFNDPSEDCNWKASLAKLLDALTELVHYFIEQDKMG